MVELIYIYPGGCEEIIVTFITDKRMTLDETIERADVDLNEYDYIAQAVADGYINASHLKDLQNKQMTTDRLLGLFVTIEQRKNKK